MPRLYIAPLQCLSWCSGAGCSAPSTRTGGLHCFVKQPATPWHWCTTNFEQTSEQWSGSWFHAGYLDYFAPTCVTSLKTTGRPQCAGVSHNYIALATDRIHTTSKRNRHCQNHTIIILSRPACGAEGHSNVASFVHCILKANNLWPCIRRQQQYK